MSCLGPAAAAAAASAGGDLVVRTSDGVDVAIGSGLLPHLHTLATLGAMMHEGAVTQHADGAPTPLPAVTADQLRLVMDFYSGAAIDWPRQDLYALLSVADYLDAPALCDEAAHQIALTLMGKSADEMREILGLPDDLTAAEKESLMGDFDWKRAV